MIASKSMGVRDHSHCLDDLEVTVDTPEAIQSQDQFKHYYEVEGEELQSTIQNLAGSFSFLRCQDPLQIYLGFRILHRRRPVVSEAKLPKKGVSLNVLAGCSPRLWI